MYFVFGWILLVVSVLSFFNLSLFRDQVAHFPPYLYEHLVEKENKGIILIMNKCDLVPPSLILAWEHYFARHFPKLIVVPFFSLEGRRGKRGLLKMAAESALCLVDACQKLVEGSGKYIFFFFFKEVLSSVENYLL